MMELGIELGMAGEELAILILIQELFLPDKACAWKRKCSGRYKEVLILKGNTKNISKKAFGAKFQFCHLGLSFFICK